ncbi:MAG: GNAT family N-acetyltransferase [Solirubrobacterales bacterium]|nr:GNAT family N-acetyltransferase [Solirubrobacterales bacterium]
MDEVARPAIDGLEIEIELFGSCSDSCSVFRRHGVIASISPPTPERSIFNSVFAEGSDRLAPVIDELAAAYEEAGVRAWTVWVPDHDRRSAQLLAVRGHALDGAPRAMELGLDDLKPPAQPLPADVELTAGGVNALSRINDRAYGIDGPGWNAAMDRDPELPHETLLALIDGEPVAGALVLDREDDAVVSAVATLPEHQGRGLAGWIVTELLRSARGRGLKTGSLQASRAGAPVYERLGFADAGYVELWERREP